MPLIFRENCLAVGICAAFEHLPSGLGALFGSGSHDRTRHMLFCYISNGEYISFPFPENFGQVESRHLWLIYLRREFFCKNRVYGSVLQIEFKTEGTGLTVKKCGAHLVCKQDIERLSQTNEMDFDFYDNHLNSAVPADGTSRVEPSHDGNYDGAGPSGEGSSSDDGAGWGLTVMSCVAHCVFKQDIEDLIQTNEMDFVSNEYHLNSVVPAYGTSRVEPSHDGNYDGAGPSGQGSSNGMTGTERIWRPNRMLLGWCVFYTLLFLFNLFIF